MKKLLILAVMALTFVIAKATNNNEIDAGNPGINFNHQSWKEIVNKAKTDNKLIFVDFYTQWCGPCYNMATTVFTLPAVGSFYNNNFVCAKIDTENGEGIELAKKYGIHSYPTYLFIDPTTEKPVHRSSSRQTVEQFLQTGKCALNPTQRSYYLEEQYEMIYEIMKELINIGFNEFIIADISLILYLNKRGLKCNIHLSGECAEINRLSIDFFNQLNISRYIFHRKNTIDDIKSCISNNEKRDIQYEAFILNERCHYTGGFCSSFHCDELEHLCKLPYEIIKINSESCHFEEVDKKLKSYYEKLDNPIEYEESQCSGIKNKIGDTGCGLCSLKKLKEAGVTHLKVVGRGNSLENMQRDIKGLKKAIAIIDEAKDSEVYEDRIKKEIINGSCSGECYY